MKTFLFKTSTTMKDYNCKKYWIDSDIIPEIAIKAENLSAALEKFREKVNDKLSVTISKNALITKEPMYVDTIQGDTKQVGFVITGLTEILDDENGYKWIKQYVDLWVTILTVVDTDF